MNNLIFLLLRKHFRENKFNLILNIVAFIISFLALLTVSCVITKTNHIEQKIFESFPNSNVYNISKKKNIYSVNGIQSIIQYERPTIKELENHNIFNNSSFHLDLSYLLDTYEIKINGFKENFNIIFEPQFTDNNFYYDHFELNKELEIIFNKEFQFKLEEKEIIELFKFSIKSDDFIKINSFKFLNVPTVYYPYNIVKNAAELTYFEIINMNLYEYIESRDSNSSETNYSLLFVDDNFNLSNFHNEKISELYSIESNSFNISKSFMDLFSSIINFSFYFLIIISLLVLILFFYTINLVVSKNHKEISILKVLGKKTKSIKFIYSLEVFILYSFSFFVSVILCFAVCKIISKIFFEVFNINLNFMFSYDLIICFYLILSIFIIFFTSILLIKINKVDIRKELNSL